MTGGTQTNLTIICAALRPFHGVYGTVQSHINTHEAGAIERTGHKVIDLRHLTAKSQLHDQTAARAVFRRPQPRTSGPAQNGLYLTADRDRFPVPQRRAGSAVCRLPALRTLSFYRRGRLGYGLTAPDNDLTLADITNNCDVFCIGGTKCGALFGEAAVIINPALKDDFRTIMKQGGAVLAKGRLLGLQFETLFTDGLYYKICRHGVELALQIKAAVQERGLGFVTDSTTNQQFIISHRQCTTN